MGKKRGKNPRDEDDFDLIVPSCRHIKKGTDQTLIKKLASILDWTSCQDCKPVENKENISTTPPPDAEEEKETMGLWMCLKCGHRGCGRYSENQHAVKHYETPRSEPHCLVVSLDNWSVWCYLCDDEVEYSKTGHLAQLVTNIQKQTTTEAINRPQKRVKEEVDELEAEEVAQTVNVEESENKENISRNNQKNTKKEKAGKSQSNSTTVGNGSVPVKGLSNLGNTCFFNAVIQNLSQTQLLRETINKVIEEKTSVDIKPVAAVNLEPLVVQLEQPGSLTLAMCQLLNEIQESQKGVVTPRELFTQVCKKAPRFKGFQQQDSQELLRYLLDGMRAEEHKRVSTGIMDVLKQSSKCTDGEELKKIVKEYEKNGFPKNFVDQVFGGEFTSTIMCQQCKTVSVVMEMFLDLSLPVSDEAYRKKGQKKAVQKTSESSQDGRNSPASTSTNDNVPTGTGSKYQQKKAKKQAKKQAKHQRRQQKFDGRVTLDSLTSNADSENSDVTADVNDSEAANDDAQEETPQGEQNPAASSESEQNQSTELEKEEGDDSVTDGDSAATSSVSNRFTALSDEQESQDSTLCDEMSNVDLEGEEVTELMDKMEQVNLEDAFIEDSNAEEQSVESEDEEPEAKEYTVINQDPELAFHTLATRTTPEKQECSVQSCLFQFTEVETLTQSNSLLCVTCTKRQKRADKAGESKKNVYTDALNQMLISSPPAVLTLHLKRFQQNGYSICKVNRHVQFPMILDIAPYCTTKCKNVSEGDTQILYSLYGMVEHSGTMRSGHYTAYVKVRPNCPKPSSNGLATEGDAEPPVGSWFHISDTSVHPVSESKVQSCQAYLLFYERII
ncbi:ubiquitin carboxyl-terminal hydrolase 16 [Cololabis saira]|uniref:ubiquitin carboxyl-terminal hydrolase 16 n=1 Tax=Cololabis saira TaxID=129043 RepID=UPI002AD23827|nr:ubiquitin carboxyl-terminal hydrolase 16 [Cololabis saira]XP_061575718.1 ubiquitin carboxyl-terminal hydrolase 16 [Cololabis saira]XP_061575719.1 ubiquitin carboxyl-terminal hydrolase 16 [Cololabis saira]